VGEKGTSKSAKKTWPDLGKKDPKGFRSASKIWRDLVQKDLKTGPNDPK
jgi:hypothetical protein